MKDYLDNEVIYTVTTIENLGSKAMLWRHDDPKDKIYTRKDIRTYFRNKEGNRTPGYFFKLEEAIKYVEMNAMDIYEGSYKHVVIEAMREGFYPITEQVDGNKEEIWFEWQGSWDEGGYKRIEKPESTKCIVNWGIG